jgi:DNA invertase Pin-like site-specific DNA recombinase
MRIGYSYLRYSSPEQADGDSVRRQTKATADWCKRHDVLLDKTRTYLDRGKSAYHGRHRQKGGALRAFLEEVERGDIPRGSVLIVENLDRLSRENPWEAMRLLSSLIEAGIAVATLSPMEMLFEHDSDVTKLVMAVMEFGRGHSESAVKSARMCEVWAEKRHLVREDGKVLTSMVPAWIEVRDGKPLLIPERAAIVRRMFELVLSGYGTSLIVRELTRDNVPSWGKDSPGWTKSYVHKIISKRAVIGEYQPVSKGKKDGDPVAGYFPAVVDEETWLAAQSSLARRKHKVGQLGEKVPSLFSGLLHEALHHDTLCIAWQGRTRRRVLVNARSQEGAAPLVSFPSDVFEAAILSLLKEVNPADVLGKRPEGKAVVLQAELARWEQRLRQAQAAMVEGDDDVAVIVQSVRDLDARCKGLRKELAMARQQEANPRATAWAEAQSLLDIAVDEPGRLRLREKLRAIIESIWVLIVPRRPHRLAGVQVFFDGDGRRDYLIYYRSAAFSRPGVWRACSLPAEIAPSDLDLRRKPDAEGLAKMLSTIDVDLLAGAMHPKGGKATP